MPSNSSAKQKSSNREIIGAELRKEIETLCQRVFGELPRRVAFPGGESRSAFVADVGEGIHVLARRDSRDDAILEGIVMKCLSRTGFVPAVVQVYDQWVVQKYVEGVRLPIVLDRLSSMNDREATIDSALATLVALQERAHSENLHHRVPKIRPNENWADGHLDRPRRISEVLGIVPPKLDMGKLGKKFAVSHRDFIKGDARPGNASVSKDTIVWFDWEGCGRRNSLDDLVYVMADEWTNLDAAAEARLLEKYVEPFARGRSRDEAWEYVMAFGVFHMCARTRRAIKYRQRDGRWWSRETCLMGDKLGVTKSEVGRMCLRAQRWSAEVEELQPLVTWFDEVMVRLRIEESHVIDMSDATAPLPADALAG